ncbi:hypothetical protein [Halovenus halobia]|uniref:hypothetical protein n=1 Tax=Halovenus halobia TaxID=3396622 RepID=UPI003F577F76
MKSATDERIPAWVRARLGVDSRAIGAFRVALGLVLLVDVLSRARHLRALYTDAGIVPRSVVLAEYGGPYELVLSLPDPWYPLVLFPIGVVCGLALIAGRRPRLSVFAGLLVVLLLQMRNPYVLNGGDVLLRILFVWALFLPYEDARLGSEGRQLVSIATAGLVLQTGLVYAVNATHKIDGDTWWAGDAVAQVLATEQYTYLFGDFVLDFFGGTGLLVAANYAWIALLVCSPLLVLATGRLRTALVSLFALVHVGMLLTLAVGHFPLVSLASLVVLYPPGAWDWVQRSAGRVRNRLGVSAPALDSISSWERSTLRFPSGAVPDRVRSVAHAVVFRAVPAVLVTFSLLSAAGVVGFPTPEPTDEAIETADFGQNWQMFAPEPPDRTWWIATPAERPDGTSVDAFHDRPFAADSPAQANHMASFRWRKYFQTLRFADTHPRQTEYARYLCENRNIERVELYYGYQTVPGEQPYEAGGETLAAFECSEFTE